MTMRLTFMKASWRLHPVEFNGSTPRTSFARKS